MLKQLKPGSTEDESASELAEWNLCLTDPFPTLSRVLLKLEHYSWNTHHADLYFFNLELKMSII
jgi:hypothetical protein